MMQKDKHAESALMGALSRARELTTGDIRISCENKAAARVDASARGDLLIVEDETDRTLVRIFNDEDGYAHWCKESEV